MSSRQYITDSATRHSVFLQRYAGGQSEEARKVLRRLSRDINARLSLEPTDFQRTRLETLLRDIDALSITALASVSKKTIDGAQESAKAEAAFSARLFTKATTADANFIIPSDEILIINVMNASMGINANSSITINDALRDFGIKKQRQISTTIVDGVTLGDTTPQIARKVGGLINTLQSRQITSLVQTITNHVSSAARNEIYKANSDIIEGYQWVSTLDSKTTLICGTRDGHIYRNIGIDPMPPAHWSCRSTTIPAIIEEFDIGKKLQGKRPSIGGSGVKELNSKTTYAGWLKRQPTAFVDEALGVERSILFRSGKLKLDKFVDPTGRVYTLKQLEDLNPLSFLE